MLISFECSNCDTVLEIDASQTGSRAECPSCGTSIATPIPRIEQGTTLGNFYVEERIGRGGMGDVYLATQLSMDRKVALKVLPLALTRNKRLVNRFINEVRMSARLEHPNIVTAFEAGEDNGYYYLAMSYINGRNIGDRCKKEGPLPELEALGIAEKIADALDYAWREFKILHRDIKPSNIMVDVRGTVKLMDMGISKSLSEHQDAELTIAGTLVGTPQYMSPEQSKSPSDIDFRADLYSLGATLYYLVCGSPPYTGDSIVDIVNQHNNAPFPPPQTHNSKVSLACTNLLKKMLSKDPDDRHSDWQELIGEISELTRSPSAVGVPGAGPGGTPAGAPVKAPASSTSRKPPVSKGDASGLPRDKTTTRVPPPLEKTRPPPVMEDLPRPQKFKGITGVIFWLLIALVVAGAVFFLKTRKKEPDKVVSPNLVRSVQRRFKNRRDGDRENQRPPVSVKMNNGEKESVQPQEPGEPKSSGPVAGTEEEPTKGHPEPKTGSRPAKSTPHGEKNDEDAQVAVESQEAGRPGPESKTETPPPEKKSKPLDSKPTDPGEILAAAMDRIAASMLKGDPESALVLLEKINASAMPFPVGEQIRETREVLEGVDEQSTRKEILASFREDIERTVDVSLKGGERTVKIVRVVDQTIICIPKYGKRNISFDLQEVTAGEKARRLADRKDRYGTNMLVAGLLYAGIPDRESAVACFSSLPSALSKALVAAVRDS